MSESSAPPTHTPVQSGVVEHRHVSMAAVREDLLKNSGLKIPPNFKQLQAYELCLRDHRHKHRWMGAVGHGGLCRS